jgi:hypothetical protein
MKRVIPVLAIGAGILIVSCDDSLSPRESGTASLSIVVENSQAQVDQAMVHLRGPTNRDLSITPGTTDTITGLQPGSYTVALEGLTNGMVEEFGETTGVQVRAGSNTAVSVTLGSFSTSVDWTHCGNPGEVMMDVSSVGGASQYRIEWDTNSDFSNAGSYMSSSTSATFDVGSGGAWYYVRAQAVSAYDGSGVWSELDSVLVELLMESHFPQDVEGWTSYDNADSLPAHQDCSAFGGSGGCLRFLDWQGGVYGGFVAPTSWTSNADWTEYYGGSISYKLYFDVAPTDVLADLEIVGPSYSLLFQIYSTCYPQTGVWQEFDVHLGTAPTYACEAQPEPTNWYISTTGATATLPQILAVLSDVSGFRIRMEYTTLADDAYLDDVEVRLPGALASCQRIRDHDPSAADGDYSITPDTVAFTVYCHDMEGTPASTSRWSTQGILTTTPSTPAVVRGLLLEPMSSVATLGYA